MSSHILEHCEMSMGRSIHRPVTGASDQKIAGWTCCPPSALSDLPASLGDNQCKGSSHCSNVYAPQMVAARVMLSCDRDISRPVSSWQHVCAIICGDGTLKAACAVGGIDLTVRLQVVMLAAYTAVIQASGLSQC